MGEAYNLKLNITLDSDKDAAIIEFFDDLKARHKTPDFMRQLLEATLEGGILDLDKAQGLKELSNNLEKWVENSPKSRFINEVTAKCNHIIETVNKTYALANELYMSARLGKALGLEERSKAVLCSQFMIEYEINKLNAIIGASVKDSSYASRRMEELDAQIEEVIRVTIERYSELLDEIKSATRVEAVQVVTQVPAQVENKVEETPAESKQEENKEIVLDLSPDEEAVMDMDIDDSNLDTLLDFFN